MDELLFLLLKKGAHLKPIKISTTLIADALGMSQQNVSRKLILLTQLGQVERTNKGLLLTTEGASTLHGIYSDLKSVFEPNNKIQIIGTIISGVGDGKYYLSLDGYKTPIKNPSLEP